MEIETLIEGLIDDLYEINKADFAKPKGLGPSWIGHPCGRYIWMKWRGFDAGNPFDYRDRLGMIFKTGSLLEKLILDSLMEAGYKIKQSQDWIRLQSIAGKIDGILVESGLEYLIEVKSANDRIFDLVVSKGVKKGKQAWYAQAQLYLRAKKKELGLLILINKNNAKIHIELIRYNTKDASTFQRRAIAIKNSPELPEMISEDQKHSECYFCEFKLPCSSPSGFHQVKKNCGTCVSFEGETMICNNQKNLELFDERPVIKDHRKKCKRWDYLFSK
jgi:CRISPR/Cas system-associated exonuclease Cas4 (RecB family)